MNYPVWMMGTWSLTKAPQSVSSSTGVCLVLKPLYFQAVTFMMQDQSVHCSMCKAGWGTQNLGASVLGTSSMAFQTQALWIRNSFPLKMDFIGRRWMEWDRKKMLYIFIIFCCCCCLFGRAAWHMES